MKEHANRYQTTVSEIVCILIAATSVILGKMARHARLLALLMAKLKGKSKSGSNMALGQCIGLQHIQRSMF